MRILIVTPAGRKAPRGNRVTALRFALHLRRAGHAVRVRTEWDGRDAELLIALHAVRSRAAVEEFGRARPGGRRVVVLTGTDLYGGLEQDPAARECLAKADAAIVLHRDAARDLPAEVRAGLAGRVHVVLPAAWPPRPRPAFPLVARGDVFEAVVVANLRAVKEPLLPLEALEHLPRRARIRVVHVGEALEPGYAERARAATHVDPRYQWLGALPRQEAVRRIARARVVLVPSRAEGGANVVAEAAVCGVPILASRVAGNLGLLGADHPGLFAAGDARALADLLALAAADAAFLATLAARARAIAPHHSPDAERRALLAALPLREP